VRSLCEFGAFVDIGGVDALLHVTDMSWGHVTKPEEIVKVGDEIEAKIIKINKEKKKISLSLKETLADPWTTVSAKYAVGGKLTGRVVRIQDFGAFVEIEPGVDGLIPLSEMSWTKRVRTPNEVVKEGDMVEVAIIGVDAEKKRISLSLKQTATDPWLVIAERYPIGSTIKGKVARTADFGAFINLEDGIDGLIHISELSDHRVHAVTDKVKPGDEVEVRVIGLDPANKKISLSMKPPPKQMSAEERAEIAAPRKRKSARKRRPNPRHDAAASRWTSAASAWARSIRASSPVNTDAKEVICVTGVPQVDHRRDPGAPGCHSH
jgi:small subunit ribosomal protein S1